MLMENWYRRKDAWLRARPAVCRALLRVSRALTLLVYAVYIGGMALLLAIKSGLKAPLLALLGHEGLAGGVRYFLLVLVA